MAIIFEIIKSRDINQSHKEIFATLLKIQKKVRGDLSNKADRCKIICIAFEDDEPIAIGAIKPKTKSDFNVEKADLLSHLEEFEWELGYLFTKEKYTGRGIASNIVSLLIEEFGKANLMASTEITANPGMVQILGKNGFKHYGKPWKSDIHDNYLGLFLKFQ